MGKEDTRRLKQIMTSAGEEAKRLGNSKIYPEHLFLGLLKLRSGRAIDILMSLGLDFYEVKDKIEQRLEGKRYKSDKVESLDFTLAANSVLKRVSDEAWDLGDDELDSEHVMLAILKNQAGFVTKLFKTMNIDYDIFKEAVLKEKMRMQSEFNDEGDDPEDGEDESSMYNPYRQGDLFLLNPILPCWIISGTILRKPRRKGLWTRLWDVTGRLSVWLKF